MADELDEPIQPEPFGLIKIPLPVPPNLEQVLGYPGEERYVAFHECRVSVPGLFIEDANGRWPGIAAGWSLFCKHPAVARILEALRLDLSRVVPVTPWNEWLAMPKSERDAYWSKTRYLVLDRRERALYVGIQPNAVMFLLMESMSRVPDSEDDEEDSGEDFDMVPSPTPEQDSTLQEEPRLAAEFPAEIDREVLERLRYWLDQHEPLEREYRPGATESCGFRCTDILIELGQLEDAFDYRGGRRYFSLHWSPKTNHVFVCDGIGRWALSEALDTWNGFLNHPLVKPHLQTRDENGRAAPIDFAGHKPPEAHPPSFLTAEQAREMEADLTTHCLLYDRARGRVYTGTWGSALLFHSLVDEVLEEDWVSSSRAKPSPLLAWLDERQEAPGHLFAVAASHQQHGQTEETLAMLYRCLDREPTSHMYWCRLSQTLASLSRWEEALDAADKAVAYHASAARQHLSAGYLLKWKAQCLFWLQRYREAADLYRLTIEVEEFTHHADTFSLLARCYERMGVYEQAVQARESQVRDRADSASEALKAREIGEVDDDIVQDERFLLSEAWFDLGRCYLLANNIAPAEWAFWKAVESDARSARAHAELGALLWRLGQANEAQQHLESALALANERLQQSPDGHAYAQLAFVRRAMGNEASADEAEQRATELGWKTTEEERRVMGLEVQAHAAGSPLTKT